MDLALREAFVWGLIGVDLVDDAPQRKELGAADFLVRFQVGDCFWGNAVWRWIGGWEGLKVCLSGEVLEVDGAIREEEEVDRADVLVLTFGSWLDELIDVVDP